MAEVTTLESGLRIVTETMPGVSSAAVGFFVGSGSRDEAPATAGASHFLEHLLFKGTARRTAHDIAVEIESVGGDSNAYTTAEHTAFYARLPAAHTETAVDVLADVVWSAALDPADVETEREVVVEEIHVHADSPEDVAHEAFARALYPGDALGRPVLGELASVEALTRDTIADFHRDHYGPANVVVVAAGAVDHGVFVDLVAARAPTAGGRPPRDRAPFATPEANVTLEDDTEQVHVVIGRRAFGDTDPDRFALAVLDHALGGGWSSRLNEHVREDRGLSYNVYSFRAGYDDTGAFGAYAATSPERAGALVELLRAEIDAVLRDGLTADELAAAVGYLRGSLALAYEDSGSHLHRLGQAMWTHGEVHPLARVDAALAAVTAADVTRVCERLTAEPEVLVTLGPT